MWKGEVRGVEVAKNKGLEPVEEYMESCLRQGYSHYDVVKALQKRGYDQSMIALAEKTSRYRTLIKAEGVALIVLLFVALWAGAWVMMSAPKQGIPSLSESQSLIVKSFECLNIADDDARTSCLNEIAPLVEGESKSIVSTKDSGYPDYISLVGFLAGLRNDPQVCSQLDDQFVHDCKEGVSFLHASITGNPNDCSSLSSSKPQLGYVFQSNQPRIDCVFSLVTRKDPSSAQALQEQRSQVVLEAIKEVDESKCNALLYVPLVEDCVYEVKASVAIQHNSKEECEAIPDAHYRLFCLNVLAQRAVMGG